MIQQEDKPPGWGTPRPVVICCCCADLSGIIFQLLLHVGPPYVWFQMCKHLYTEMCIADVVTKLDFGAGSWRCVWSQMQATLSEGRLRSTPSAAASDPQKIQSSEKVLNNTQVKYRYIFLSTVTRYLYFINVSAPPPLRTSSKPCSKRRPWLLFTLAAGGETPPACAYVRWTKYDTHLGECYMYAKEKRLLHLCQWLFGHKGGGGVSPRPSHADTRQEIIPQCRSTHCWTRRSSMRLGRRSSASS